MGKEKFVYNTQTLRYEKVEETLGTRLLRFLGFFCAVLVFAVIIVFFAQSYLDSPKEKILKRQLQEQHDNYEIVKNRIVNLEKVLGNIQDRDAQVHRMIFGMNPIDNDVWNGGLGGHDKYGNLKQYDSEGLMVNTMKRLDKLSRQIALQSKSLDTIETLTQNKEEMLASIPSIKPVREDKLNKSMFKMSGFGMRVHPIHKVRKMHAGIDFAARTGTKIYATGHGKIVKVNRSKSGYGNNVTIDHGYGYQTLYAHMNRIDVRVGEKVKKGQVIGTVGSTGTSTAPHLHYEVREKGKAINPIHFCMDGLNPQEYQDLVEQSSKGTLSFD